MAAPRSTARRKLPSSAPERGHRQQAVLADGAGDSRAPDRHDPVLPVTFFLECLAQRRNVDADIASPDDDAAPHPRHQLVFGDDRALGRRQYAEDVERPAPQPQRLVVAAQLASSEIQPEPSEPDLPIGHRIVPIKNNEDSEPKILTGPPPTVHPCSNLPGPMLPPAP